VCTHFRAAQLLRVMNYHCPRQSPPRCTSGPGVPFGKSRVGRRMCWWCRRWGPDPALGLMGWWGHAHFFQT
jgi:hypothetical protein